MTVGAAETVARLAKTKGVPAVMKCCGSPAPSIAANAPAATRAVQSTLQAVLFSELLKPLGKDCGPLGDLLAASFAQRVAGPRK
jgi:hypothetical protein